MPISFEPIKNEEVWSGYVWLIEDEGLLAELIAKVALGQYRHVLHILSETDCGVASPAASTFEGARQLLTVPDDNDPWHRDGWLFQVIAWIAAHQLKGEEIIAPPHMQHADKGFDGLHVHIDPQSNDVTSVVICEEKATGRPRRMIKNNVWTEFESLEEGGRDHELVSKVTTLLETQPRLDLEQAIGQIFWEEARSYRVAITVGDTHGNEAGRKRLFKGYDTVVEGDVARRRAETLYLKDLRAWMQQLADNAIEALEELEAAHV